VGWSGLWMVLITVKIKSILYPFSDSVTLFWITRIPVVSDINKRVHTLFPFCLTYVHNVRSIRYQHGRVQLGYSFSV